MIFRIASDVMVMLHFAVLAFLVFGGFAAWIWPWALKAHIPLVGWGVLTSLFLIPCPLTAAENWLRQLGGLPAFETDFIETYIISMGSFFGSLNRLRVATFLIIAISWVVAVRLERIRRLRALSMVPARSGEPAVPLGQLR